MLKKRLVLKKSSFYKLILKKTFISILKLNLIIQKNIY